MTSQDPAAIHRIQVRVYYEDTDFSGVVQHTAYLRFLERGRTEFLRVRGISHSSLFTGAAPLAFAVIKMEIAFLKPARMDDMLEVETRINRVGGASIMMAQAIRRGDEVLVMGDVRVAAVAEGRAQRLSGPILAQLGGKADRGDPGTRA
jgi:acyl-CoA thioester hydrolase